MKPPLIFLRIIIYIGLLFCAYPLRAQITEGDSLKNALTQASHDTLRIKILNKLAEILPEGEWEGYNEQMESLAVEKLKTAKGKEATLYQSCLAAAYNNKSITYKIEGRIAEALELNKKALELFEKIDDKVNVAVNEYNIAKLYQALGDIGRAIQSLQRAEKISGDYHTEVQPYCLNQLGFISKEQGEFDQALKYHETAYRISESMKDDESMAFTLTCLGLVYMDLNRLNDARDAFLKTLPIYSSLNHQQNLAASYLHLGEVYKKQGENEQALKNFSRSLDINRKRADKGAIAASLGGLGTTYLQIKNLRDAEKNFREALALSEQLGFPKGIYTSADGLYTIYKGRGDVAGALRMHELAVEMKDSMNNEATRKNTIRSQFRYEFEKKAAADSIRAADEKKFILAQAATQRYAIFGGALLILGLVGFLVYRLRVNQRMKELKLRTRIASDLHDDVGSALSSISLFAGVARLKPGDSSVSIVEKIENTSRETIENMSDIVWSIQPHNDSFRSVLQKMKQFGEDIMHSAGIEFYFDYHPSLEKLSLNMIQRKNLYLIYKEALNNTAKYSQAKELHVTLTRKGKHIELAIQDNGVGFEAGSGHTGNGLTTMKQRAGEMEAVLEFNSVAGQGTRLLLTI